MTEHEPYDLVIEMEGQLQRIQCKWASLDGDVVRVGLVRSRRGPNGHIRRVYDSTEVDAVAAYCEELGRSYVLPFESIAGLQSIHLRLGPTRNGQRAALRFAADYEFGAIAQQAERLRGTQEVAGSNPASSTEEATSTTVGAHEFRNLFGWYIQRVAAGEEFLVTRRGKPFARLSPP